MEQTLIKIDVSTEKSFGIFFSIIFMVITLFQLIDKGLISYWSFSISILLLIISFVRPSILRKPNLWWFKLGQILGSVIAPIVMGLIYILIIIPTGFILRIFKKDPLNTRADKHKKSYWICRETPPQPMKDQF
jgi:hypothetical protein